MYVVSVWHVGMRVPRLRVMMHMAVFAFRHWLVHMVVMAVIVPVRMIMFERLVLVFMTMRLGQMQHNARQHQGTACCHQAAGRAVA
jgi:hypothetical protein